MDAERVYTSLYRIRRVEEEIARIYPTDKIKSPVHLSLGQEAVSVGVCEALDPDDVVFGTYSGHALYLAKGGDLKGMMAELYGKAAGVAGGKGGSVHLVDPEHGVMGMSAVVGTTIPQAAGYAYSIRVRGGDLVVAAFFGELLHEAWTFKRRLSPTVSTPRIDDIYERATVAGALGGKLLGAGGTGFVLFYVQPIRRGRWPQQRMPSTTCHGEGAPMPP